MTIGNFGDYFLLLFLRKKGSKNSRRLECIPAKKTNPLAYPLTSSSRPAHNAAPIRRQALPRFVLYLTLALFNQPTKVSVSIAKVPDNHLNLYKFKQINLLVIIKGLLQKYWHLQRCYYL
jgi:hypothetical protein